MIDAVARTGFFKEFIEIIDIRRCINKTLRNRHFGMREDLEDRAFLDHSAFFHNRRTVADVLDDRHLVRDHDNRDAQPLVDLPQKLQNRPRRLRVKCARRFVAQQHLGIIGQRAGNGHTLLLTAGELRGVCIRFIRKLNELQKRRDLGLAFGRRKRRQLQRHFDVLGHRARGHQVEVLENHADTLTNLTERLFVELSEVDTVDDHFA